MYSTAGFEFVQVEAQADLRLDGSLSTREQLFQAYARALRFPAYFGRNWDAFVDCLSDLSWIDQDSVSIVHEVLPTLRDSELRTYLECLQDVIARIRPQDRPKPRFLFRERDRERIEGLFREE
ncbi:MAG: barstar family protein [Myxococcales bacterium]